MNEMFPGSRFPGVFIFISKNEKSHGAEQTLLCPRHGYRIQGPKILQDFLGEMNNVLKHILKVLTTLVRGRMNPQLYCFRNTHVFATLVFVNVRFPDFAT